MNHYTFNVVETREITFEIEAENIHEAEMLARDAYYGFMEDYSENSSVERTGATAFEEMRK